MPRLPQYQPNQIGPADVTGARMRAANNNGGVFGGLADGLQSAGNAVAQYANEQDRLNAENDDTQSRLLSAEAGLAYSEAQNEYLALKAGAARDAQGQFLERLESVRSGALERTSNPRMRRLLEERLSGVHQSTTARISGHAVTEQRAERDTSMRAQEAAFVEMAAAENDPAMRDTLLASGLAVRRDRLIEIEGIDPETSSEVLAQEELAYSSQVHGAVLDRMFAAPIPDVDEALEYLEAYGDEMTGGLRSELLARVADPLRDRLARSNADVVMGLLADLPNEAAPVVNVPGAAPDLDTITANTESNNRDYDTRGRAVTSSAGARFAMQVMPSTARDPGFGLRPADPNDAADMNRLGREYRAVMEERYGGDLAKMWAAYNAGPGRVDQAVEDHGGDWLAHMPDETRAYVRRNVAQLGERSTGEQPYANAPRSWDRVQIEDALNRAAAEQGWSPEVMAVTRREIEQRMDRDEALLDRQYRDASREAAEIISGLPDGLTSIGQLPSDIRRRMDPVRIAELEGDIRDRRRAVSEAARADAQAARARELEYMARFEPEAFLALDLTREAGRLSEAQYHAVRMDQGTLEQDRREPPSPQSRTSLQSMVNNELNHQRDINGMDWEPEEKAAIYDLMLAQMMTAGQAANGREMPPDAARSAFAFATRTRPSSGWLSRSRNNSEVLTFERLPPDFIREFDENWPDDAPPAERADYLAAYMRAIGRQ